jgi:hypothetical protein
MSIPYYPTDWHAQCEAKCRKTGARCPHTCRARIPNTIAAHAVMDEKYHMVAGRPANLCQGHYMSFNARAKRLLALALIDGGHLSPYNEHGAGSIIVAQDRIDFKSGCRAKIPPAWGVIGSVGNVPAGLLDRLPKFPVPVLGTRVELPKGEAVATEGRKYDEKLTDSAGNGATKAHP